jgi:hypothetical protein
MEVLKITEPPRRAADVTIKLSGDEFEQLTELFYRAAYADAPLTREVLDAAREAGVRIGRLPNPGFDPSERWDERKKRFAPENRVSICAKGA